MKIESEYQDINGVHHVTVSGDYGILKSGEGRHRSELIERLAGQVQLAEIEMRAYRAGEKGDAFWWVTFFVGVLLVAIGGIWVGSTWLIR